MQADRKQAQPERGMQGDSREPVVGEEQPGAHQEPRTPENANQPDPENNDPQGTACPRRACAGAEDEYQPAEQKSQSRRRRHASRVSVGVAQPSVEVRPVEPQVEGEGMLS